MSGDAQLLLMIAGVHILGLAIVAILLIPALRDNPDSPPGSSGSGSDDGWGRGPSEPPKRPNNPIGGLPLPDALPARVRLRGHERLRDRTPRPERRPSREPEPRPVRVRQN